jgi:hypothetical protein
VRAKEFRKVDCHVHLVLGRETRILKGLRELHFYTCFPSDESKRRQKVQLIYRNVGRCSNGVQCDRAVHSVHMNIICTKLNDSREEWAHINRSQIGIPPTRLITECLISARRYSWGQSKSTIILIEFCRLRKLLEKHGNCIYTLFETQRTHSNEQISQ